MICIFTGRMHTAHMLLFRLLRAILKVFLLHMGITLQWWGEIWHRYTPFMQYFTSINFKVGPWAPKTVNFTEFWNINTPHGHIPCAIFMKCPGFVGITFVGLGILAQGVPELCGFNLAPRCGFSPKFSMPLAVKVYVGCENFWRCKTVMDLWYRLSKYGGSWYFPPSPFSPSPSLSYPFLPLPLLPFPFPFSSLAIFSVPSYPFPFPLLFLPWRSVVVMAILPVLQRLGVTAYGF